MMEALPVIKVVEKIFKKITPLAPLTLRGEPEKKTLIIWLSPSGKQFDNIYAEKISKKYSNIIIVCGRYEGIDERVKKVFRVEEVSVGPYVLTGGELPAMVVLDTISRRIPGVLGKIESVEENRISSPEVYTRPEVLEYKGKKYRVPKILLSGDHKKIEEWRNQKRK
jgi:tRNA (guanine37-N1)-methyltransferase